jgi:uncharacterized protein (DUF2062 family)
MPKRSLRKFLLSPTRLMRVNGLERFGNLLERRELWHVSRISISRATAIGLFCSMIPLPGQMFVAVFLAIRLGANVPLSFMLIFITNPITMPVIYLGAYLLGCALLGTPVLDVTAVNWLYPLSAEFLGHPARVCTRLRSDRRSSRVCWVCNGRWLVAPTN